MTLSELQAVPNYDKLDPNAQKLLFLLVNGGKRTVSEIEPNEFPFRVVVRGTDHSLKCGFSARLDLWAIRDLTRWTSHHVASLSEYPDMARQGDWSGIRDSSEAHLKLIFDRYVLPQIHRA